MIWDKAKNALKMFDNVVHGLQTIQRLTKVGEPNANLALAAIDGVIKSILDGFEGKATPEAVHLEIASLEDQIAAHNVAADAKAKQKFQGEG